MIDTARRRRRHRPPPKDAPPRLHHLGRRRRRPGTEPRDLDPPRLRARRDPVPEGPISCPPRGPPEREAVAHERARREGEGDEVPRARRGDSVVVVVVVVVVIPSASPSRSGPSPPLGQRLRVAKERAVVPPEAHEPVEPRKKTIKGEVGVGRRRGKALVFFLFFFVLLVCAVAVAVAVTVAVAGLLSLWNRAAAVTPPPFSALLLLPPLPPPALPARFEDSLLRPSVYVRLAAKVLDGRQPPQSVLLGHVREGVAGEGR